VGISIPAAQLEATLERAVGLAESSAQLPQDWLDRAERIGECPSKSYIAAFGTALLAKASEPAVDALYVKAGAGPTAYSMRGVAKVLVERASHYGYHLGVTRREPLNNQPWFQISRVDEPIQIRANARPYHKDLVRYLNDLNRVSPDQALAALAAFLRLRLAYAEQQRSARVDLGPVSLQLQDLIGTIEHFIRDDPEGGRRGQALVAAVLDLVHDEVRLSAVNDPTPLDVRVLREGRVVLGVEVKQKAVGEDEALELAEGVASAGADKALLVALAEGQRPLNEERVLRDAAEAYGVATVAYVSVQQLVSQAIIATRLTAAKFMQELPATYLERMQEHEVSQTGQQYWADLLTGLAKRSRGQR
jgi:hypothetical protein